MGKILAILGISAVLVLLLIAGGMFFWWQHYKSTPAYTLALLVDAAQRNDTASVQSIVDTDTIVKNLASEVTDKAASRYGLALGGGAREQIEKMTPTLLPRIKESVNAAIMTRVKEISEKADHKPFILVALGLPYVVNVVVDGDKATATVSNQPVELDLMRAETGWKIVGYHDDELVQRAIDEIIKDLPAVGAGGERKPTESRKLKGLPALRIP